ncbi:MAG: Uma2 family endonuclease, partial [Sandaracinaceae bacterium]|nr:Uma2 family endonuclease [Sandaracinaceae bacterium]
VAPDVFVLPGVRPTRRIRSWKTWTEGTVPSFALEVVSQDVDKDYIDAPALYRELGVEELVIFDPDFEDDPDRLRFQVYRRVGKRGLVRVLATNEDRARSKVLGCWLRATGQGEELRLRLATGDQGEVLFPTEAEDEREAKEREREAKEREREAKEREREARLEAEAEVERLRGEIARLRKRKS